MGCGGSKEEGAATETPKVAVDQGHEEERLEEATTFVRQSSVDNGPLSADDLKNRLMGSKRACPTAGSGGREVARREGVSDARRDAE